VQDQAVTNTQMTGMSGSVMSVMDADIDRFTPWHAKHHATASRAGPILILETALPLSTFLPYSHNLLPRV